MSLLTKAIERAGPNICNIKVGNDTTVPIQVKLNDHGRPKTIAPGGSAAFSKGFGDQSTVHVMDEDGNYLTSKKFKALGNASCSVRQEGNRFLV